MRRTLSLLATVIVSSLVMAAGVTAAGRHESSTVTIQVFNGPPPGLFGKVSSSAGPCAHSRKVLVFLGPRATHQLVGSDITSSNGDWFVAPDGEQAGRYQAFARRKTYTRHGHSHVCDPEKSPSILNV